MTQDTIDSEVAAKAQMCADQGWRANLTFKSGEEYRGAFITAADFEQGVVQMERIGDRNIEPRLIWLKDIQKWEPDWSE